MATIQRRATNPSHADSAHVLLVEHDANGGYAPVLRSAGFRVTEVRDSSQAWKQVLSLRPQVVVTDVAIPGVDGLELCRRLRAIERTAGLPVTTVTGFARAGDVSDAQAVGFDAVLSKPCEPARLLEEIQRRLARAAAVNARLSTLRRNRVLSGTQPAATSANQRHEPGRRDAAGRAEALQRIRGEYTEMPGLTLSLHQAVRLWRLDGRFCGELLESLVSEGFLKRQHDRYGRA